MKPQKPQKLEPQSHISKQPERCIICGGPLRNDTYGQRCEDCFADAVGGVPKNWLVKRLNGQQPTPSPEPEEDD